MELLHLALHASAAGVEFEDGLADGSWLSEEVSHEDAAVLTQHFKHNIGLSMEPGAALDEALGHCPPAVGEYVVRHW